MEKKLQKEVQEHLDKVAKKAVEHSEAHIHGAGVIKEAVFGFNDGLVTVLALTAGVSAAVSDARIVILAAVAAAVASAISMSLASYIATKSQVEYYKKEIERERKEIEENFEFEKEELKELYRRKGFNEKEVEIIVRRISADKGLMLRVMLSEELHLAEEDFDNPYKSGAVMFAATVLGSFIPVIPFFFLKQNAALFTSISLGIAALFAIGAFKTRFTERNWIRSGLENTVIGIIATSLSYVIGNIAGGL